LKSRSRFYYFLLAVAQILAHFAHFLQIAAVLAGGKHGECHRVENFVAAFAALAAVGLWRATELAELRRVRGSDLLLREFATAA
jgi:hypothetical protein